MSVAPACASCGKALTESEQPCSQCGAFSCPTCGGVLQPKDRFCPRCGSPRDASPGSAATIVGEPGREWDEIRETLRRATLGEFEIRSELGRGGMAVVYLARDIALNTKVAIKVMAPGVLTGKPMVEKFVQEARTVANFNHPHIVTIHALRQAAGLHFIVMKLIPGRSLDSLIRHVGPLPLPVFQAIIYQLGSALSYAHRRTPPVVHRDVKPSNILMDEHGNAMVTDFGIAKVLEDSGQTQRSMTIGTPAYMSPEQCAERKVTGASDQYSLGVVAYEMLTGQPLFTGTPLGLLRAHLESPPPLLRASRPDCPPGLEAALLRMLAKSPEDRWPTVMLAIEALGGRPLPESDPLRETLIALGSRDPEQVPLDVPRTPLSPISRDEALGAARSEDDLTLFPGPALQLSTASPALQIGGTLPVTVTARMPSGAPSEVPPLDWRSSDPGIASVSPAGVVQGIAPGAVVITARSREGATARIRLEVVATPTPAVFAPAQAPLARGAPPGGPRRVVLEPELDMTPAVTAGSATAESPSVQSAEPVMAWLRRPSVWGSTLLVVAAVAAWLLWPVPGPSPEPANAARVQVSPTRLTLAVGDTARLRASLAAPDGRQLRGPASWTSSNPAVAGVSQDGLVTGLAQGDVLIIATSGASRDQATITVSAPQTPEPPRVGALEVEPSELRLPAGGTAVLRVQVMDSRGIVLEGRSTSWSSSDPAVARVSRRGIVTGVGPGSARVTARSENVESEPVMVTITAAIRFGVVRMLVDPWAYVIIDGRGRGQRVRGEDRLPAGVHRFRFERNGYVSVDTTITLQPDEQRLLRVQLKARTP